MIIFVCEGLRWQLSAGDDLDASVSPGFAGGSLKKTGSAGLRSRRQRTFPVAFPKTRVPIWTTEPKSGGITIAAWKPMGPPFPAMESHADD